MNIEYFREYCLSLKGVTEEMPFGPDALAFKVMGKMFALTVLDGEFSMNLKCDPELAIQLREGHPCVQPGYHMNKKHWNTIYIDGTVDVETLLKWIDHSYQLVVNGLTRKLRAELNELN